MASGSASVANAAEHKVAGQAGAGAQPGGGQSDGAQASSSTLSGLMLPDTGPTAQAAAAATPSTTATAAASVASPARQLAPALLSLSQGQNGTQHMTLRLDPAELGMVQVQIDRTAAGQANVTITADRPDTLDMLRQDQPALQRTLDQAGVPVEGRTLSFHVTEASAPAGTGSGSANGGGNASGNGQSSQSGSSQSGSFQSGSAQSGSSQSGYGGGSGSAPREQGFYGGGRRAAAADAQTAQQDQASTSKWLRVGLDITA